MNRYEAKRYTRRAQAAALALLAGAGAVAALPVQSLFAPGAADAAPPADTTAGGAQADGQRTEPKPELDWTLAANVLEEIGIQPPPPTQMAAAEEDPGDKPPEEVAAEETTPQPRSRTVVRYIGSIVGPRSTHALVTIDGRQHLLTQGVPVEGYRLVDVTENEILVDNGGVEQRIALADRTQDWAIDPPARPNLTRSDGVTQERANAIPSPYEEVRKRMAAGEIIDEEELKRIAEEEGMAADAARRAAYERQQQQINRVVPPGTPAPRRAGTPANRRDPREGGR